MNEFSSSTNFVSEQEMNDVLEEVDQVLKKLDNILEKRLRSIAGGRNISGYADNLIGRRYTQQSGTMVRQGINAISDLISTRSSPIPTVFNPHATGVNRYPLSNGLQLSDIATLLQRISGRNL